jgi:hypothetical protein
MVYWYRLKIPFADWVMSRMFLAHFGLRSYDAVNPLMAASRNAGWNAASSLLPEPWPGGPLGDNMLRWANDGHYLFPIRVSASMRMMTPPRRANFPARACPP